MMHWAARAWSVVVLALALLLPALVGAGPAPRDGVLLVELDGVVGPATAEHVSHGLKQASHFGADAVVLRLDTPGGLDAAMRDIIREILDSPVPVIGWVAPSGARAASAGTYILLSTHVAAMAPGTTLGAATPIRMGGDPTGGPQASPADEATSPEARKMINDARAYIRGLARLRGRNAEWAERAVTEAATLTAREAAKENVVELVASDLDALLSSVDGMTVEVAGETIVLRTRDAPVSVFEASWRTRLLSVLVHPNVAYLLLILGFYGILFELANPGFVFPGVLGAVFLLLALFAFAMLPINWAGLALILLGVALMIAEAFVPSFGALGIGGIIAFAIGSIILVDTDSSFFRVSLGLIVGVCIVSAAFFIGVVGLALRSRRAKVVSGREELMGATGVALAAFDRTGQVRTHGEIWQATSPIAVRSGQRVRVRGIHGLTLEVEPLAPEPGV